MNYRVDSSCATSFFLQAELDRLQSLSDDIRNSGSVAPANCWLTEIEQRKGNRVYRYVQLRSVTKQVQSRLLGRPASQESVDWQRRCQRRDMIYELEQQMRLLIELIDRQTTHPIEFEHDEIESS